MTEPKVYKLKLFDNEIKTLVEFVNQKQRLWNTMFKKGQLTENQYGQNMKHTNEIRAVLLRSFEE